MSHSSEADRQLNWPHCYNVRDLGGLSTDSGAVTQFGRIIRSDIPARLTAEGRKMMWDYGIRTIIDLRTPWQTVEEPSNVAQLDDAPRFPLYINTSIETYKAEVSTEISTAGSRAEVYCITLDHYPEQIKLIMETIANAPEGGILIHCHAGKDRTGMICALLLGLVGVPPAMLCYDYAQSQDCLWPLWEKFLRDADDEAEVDIFMRPDATKDVMQYMLDHLDAKYDGIMGYINSTGVEPATLEKLRRRLMSS